MMQRYEIGSELFARTFGDTLGIVTGYDSTEDDYEILHNDGLSKLFSASYIHDNYETHDSDSDYETRFAFEIAMHFAGRSIPTDTFELANDILAGIKKSGFTVMQS